MVDRLLVLATNGADKWIRANRIAAWAIWAMLVASCLYVRWTHNV